MQSIIVYGTMFLSSVFLANRAKRTEKKGYLLAIILILSFVSGCRKYTVGNDTITYYRYFQNILLLKDNLYSDMEKGFEYYCRFTLALVPSPQFVLLLTGVIMFTLVIWRLWEFRDIAEFDWTVASFIVLFYAFLLSGIRQGLALAIVFWGTRFLENRKYIRYAVCIALAAVFHKTAIIACASLLWELRLWKQLSKRNRFFLLLFILAAPVLAKLLMQRYTLKQYARFIEISIGTRVPVEGIFGILSLIAFEFDGRYSTHGRYNTYTNAKSVNTRNRLRQKISTVKAYYIVGLLVQTTGYISTTFSRIALYWYWFEAIFMGMMVKSRMNQKIFKIMFFLFLAYMCYSDSRRNGFHQLPYLFFWQGIQGL